MIITYGIYIPFLLMYYKHIRNLFLNLKNNLLFSLKKVFNKFFYALNPEFKFLNNLSSLEYNSIDKKSIKCLLWMSNCEQIIWNIPFSISVKDSNWRYLWLSDYLLESLWQGLEVFFGKTDDEVDFKVLSKHSKLCSEKKDLNFWIIEYQLKIENKNGNYKYLLMREKPIIDEIWLWLF